MLRVQERFNFVFGPEHREFIQSAVPVGKSWPDWRNDTDEDLRRRLAWPVEGVLSDVRNSGFWPAFWGDQPDAKDDWEREARTSCPRRGLIPVLSHRYMTSDLKVQPQSSLLGYQTDIIFYGDNLLDYLAHEFRLGSLHPSERPHVPFWSDLAEGVLRTVICRSGKGVSRLLAVNRDTPS